MSEIKVFIRKRSLWKLWDFVHLNDMFHKILTQGIRDMYISKNLSLKIEKYPQLSKEIF